MCKMSTSNEQLCAGQPDEFVLYLNYTRALQFDSKPDYAYLRSLFKDLLMRKGWQHDSKYDWASKRTMAAMAGLDVPTVPRPLLSTEISQMPPATSHEARQQQRHSNSHSHNQSSPVSAASPQQPLSSSPPLSLSQQRASVYGTDTTHPSPRDSSPRQLSPFYASQQQQQQQQRMQQQQPSQLHLIASPHNGSGTHMQSAEPGRLLSQYDGSGGTYSSGVVGQSSVYQLSPLPATASPLPVSLLHHVPALNFPHSSSLSSMNPGGGFKSLPAAFPPLLLSPLPSPQPFPGMTTLPFVPSTLSLPSHSPLHASFTHSPYQMNGMSPSTYTAHPFFSPSVSPSSTTAATLGDGSSRLSSVLPPHSLSSNSSQLSLHQHNQHTAASHPNLSPSSYSNTHSRSSLSSPLASPHFSSSSASPYLTSASSTLSLSASPLHAANHNHAHMSGPPGRSIQQLTPAPAHYG